MTDESNTRATEGSGPADTVVVGVDGSESSLRALVWAARQATWMGAPLEVVTAWDFPEHPTPLGVVPEVPWQEELMAQAQVKLEEIVRTWVPAGRPEEVRTVVIRGSAAHVLLDASSRAALLVVGREGRGGIEELLLGSVSERCVRHAPCPVVVVR